MNFRRTSPSSRQSTRFLAPAVALAIVGAAAPEAGFAAPERPVLFSVAPVFTDHAVLQRGMPVPVWGTAVSDTEVTVDFFDHTVTGTADADGRWQVKLPPMKATTIPAELKVRASQNTATFRNLIVGDVYFCSGQSNMEMSMKDFPSTAADQAAADIPALRHYRAGGAPGIWQPCTPDTVKGFSATAFYFGRRIQQETGVPVGLIVNAKGSSRIERWIPPEGFPLVPGLVRADGSINQRPSDRYGQYTDTTRKLIPFAITGMLWYQGEHNTWKWDNKINYSDKMFAMVTSLRTLWGQGDLPFYFVQLPQFEKETPEASGGGAWAEVRRGQLRALSKIPNSHMAVTIDCADTSIHPDNKPEIGDRLARLALVNTYGRKDLVASGPLFQSMRVEGNRVRISFDHVGKGLMVGRRSESGRVEEVKDGKLGQFAIAASDPSDAKGGKLRWEWADAVIEGSTVVVSSPSIKEPVAVQYANSNRPTGANLFNRDGLPASPFSATIHDGDR
jgi:sialate O-acetylesterase